jgi:transcription elongation factor GreB
VLLGTNASAFGFIACDQGVTWYVHSMSKAFTKENDNQEESENETPKLELPNGVKNYITPAGFEKLRAELQDLLKVKRPEIVKTVAWAASNGDRSENADYIYGKRRLREIDRRIRFLTKRMDAAEVVDPSKHKYDRVLFGATVTVENESGQRIAYTIVGIDEIDPENKRVSWISPIAKALFNAKVGDVVQFSSPKGEEELQILEIIYAAS